MPAEAKGIADGVAVVAAARLIGNHIEVDLGVEVFPVPVFSVRVATPSGGNATGFGCVPIRADASLAELGNVDVVVLPPILDGLDNSLAAHPDLIVWLKSLAADDVLLISRKHPQRTPPQKRWWQPLKRHCAQTPGRRLGRRAHPRPCAPPPAPLWPFRAETGRSA